MKRTLSRLILTICALLCPTLAFAQGVRWDGITLSPSGRPVAASVAVCTSPGLTTTAAQVIGNTAILTMSSNPITAGFAANMQIAVSGFTGSDTYFNVGTLQPFSSTVTISAVSATTITYALTHANASASTNGSVFQIGNVAQACAPLASIFSDAALAVPITQPGLSSSNIGNIGFYVNPGQYGIQYYGTGVTTYLQPLTLTMLFANANNTLTGTLSSVTITANDGVTPNLVMFDYRSTTIPSNTSPNKTVAYNVTTVGNTDAMERSQMTTTSVPAAGATVNKYIINSCNNCTNPNVIDGASTEGQLTGTLTGTLGVGSGNESPFSILSTGGTAAIATGGNDYVFVGSQGSPTAVTNAYGRWLRGCQGTPGSVANCYGGFSARQQSFGTVRNYAHGFEGVALFLFDGNVNKGGYDAEDAAHVTHPTFYIDGSSNTNYQAINTNGLFLCSSDSACRVRVTAAGLGTITGLFPTVAANHSVGTALLPYLSAFIGPAATNNTQITMPTATAARTMTLPDGNSATVMPASLVTTAAASDNVTVTGMTASGHCTFSPTNAAGATNIATTFISAKAANQITVSHTASANLNYDILCTSN